MGCGRGAWRFLCSAGIKPLGQLLKGWVDSPSRGIFKLRLAVSDKITPLSSHRVPAGSRNGQPEQGEQSLEIDKPS